MRGGIHHGPAVIRPGNIGLEHRRFAAFFLDDSQCFFRAAGYHGEEGELGTSSTLPDAFAGK